MNVAEALRVLSSRVVIGWLEHVGVPDLMIPCLTAKTDTGARTSSLHADKIEGYTLGGAPYVRFLPPQRWVDARNAGQYVEMPVIDKRTIRNSGGETEIRFVIGVSICIGQLVMDIELNLTDRTRMRYDMLLGRTTLSERFLIQPGITFAAGLPRI